MKEIERLQQYYNTEEGSKTLKEVRENEEGEEGENVSMKEKRDEVIEFRLENLIPLKTE